MPRLRLPKCGGCGYPFVPYVNQRGKREYEECRECCRLFAAWEKRMKKGRD